MITADNFTAAVRIISSAQGKEVILVTPVSASSYLGSTCFAALCNAVSEACPNCPHKFFLDCQDNAGEALSAIRSGIKHVIFTGNREAAKRLSSVAEQTNCELLFSR